MYVENDEIYIYNVHKKKFIKYVDEDHLCCYSYPNCDVDPQGCHMQTFEVEPYGHRD